MNITVLPTVYPTTIPTTIYPTFLPTIVTVGPQSTGMSGAIGTLDYNWLLISTPNGPTNVHPYICTPNGGWVPNSANVNWIAAFPDETLGIDAPGYYVYQTTFILSATTYSSVIIPMSYVVDDQLKKIVLNGITLFSGSSLLNSLTTFNLVSGYAASFVLSVTVYNTGGQSGLQLQFGTPVYTTASPTVMPSLSPSAFPTRLPSIQPSAKPSTLPSSFPSIVPSSSPSISPTATPTSSPTKIPSSAPTIIPTFPTASPTVVPSANPTAEPTLQPTA